MPTAAMDEGIALMSIAKDAKSRFLEAELAEKTYFSVMLSNASFRHRKLSAIRRKPFDIIGRITLTPLPENRGAKGRDGESAKWQGSSDSNRGPSVLETDALTS